jgi:hypothetical protein
MWWGGSDVLGINIMVQYYVGPVITVHGSITETEYVYRLGNLVYPMIQMLFSNSDAVFQDDNVSTHIARPVQSLFEEDEGELEHFPWPV